jgi:hypothetical protein
MNRITRQATLLLMCLLLVCAEVGAQKKPEMPASSPAMTGVPQAIRYGIQEVNPKYIGGGSTGYAKMFISPEGRFKAVLRGNPERTESDVLAGEKS